MITTIGGLLTTLFIILKLGGAIDWSWFWVFSPVWISLILWFLTMIGVLFISKK